MSNEQSQYPTQEQPSLSRVKELVSEDKRWNRSTTLSAACTLTSKEDAANTYTIEAITDPEHADVLQVQKIMEGAFGMEEVDPLEVTKAGMKGESVKGEKGYPKYQIYVIKDGDKVVALYTGGTLDIKNEEQKPTGEMVFMGCYARTIPEYQQKGLARELYVSALIGAAHEAQSQGKKLVGVIGETTSTSERTWESVKRRRPYVEDILPDGKRILTEVPYIQPALDFDEKGNPAADAGESPEHIMTDYFGDGEISKETLYQMVSAMYDWCNIWPVSDYEEEDRTREEAQAAHENNVAYVKRFKDQLSEFLNSHGKLVFMNSKEKESAIQSGEDVQEYTDANKSDNDE